MTDKKGNESNVVQLTVTRIGVPTVAAAVDDHDRIAGQKASNNWPSDANKSSRLIHFHFVELLHAWNLNPFRRELSTATVDEYAETKGVTRFVFCSKQSLEDFLDFYGLDDFVVHKGETIDTPEGSTWWCVHFTNKFGEPEANSFLTTYRDAMNTLAVIHDERERAIVNDGGKVGFICADHFAARETYELMRIRKARESLAAGNITALHGELNNGKR